MPIQTRWLVDSQVLRAVLVDDISLADMDGAVQEIIQSLSDSETDSGVHLIIDVRYMSTYDENIVNVKKASMWFRPLYDGGKTLSALVILPYPIPMLKVVLDVMARIMRPQFHIVESWDEAVQYLLEQDLELIERIPDDPELT